MEIRNPSAFMLASMIAGYIQEMNTPTSPRFTFWIDEDDDYRIVRLTVSIMVGKKQWVRQVPIDEGEARFLRRDLYDAFAIEWSRHIRAELRRKMDNDKETSDGNER